MILYELLSCAVAFMNATTSGMEHAGTSAFIRTSDDLDTCEAITTAEIICDPLQLIQHFVVQFCVYLHITPFDVKGNRLHRREMYSRIVGHADLPAC